MTVLFVAYGMAGGLGATIVTDFIQGILIIVFSFLLLPFILHKVGGPSGIRAAIPDPDKMFSLVAPGQIGIFYIVVIAFNALMGITAQPHVMGNCAAGRTEMEGRVGFMGGTMIKRVCTIAWSLTGLAAVVYFSGQQVEPDDIYGLAARNFPPPHTSRLAWAVSRGSGGVGHEYLRLPHGRLRGPVHRKRLQASDL